MTRLIPRPSCQKRTGKGCNSIKWGILRWCFCPSPFPCFIPILWVATIKILGTGQKPCNPGFASQNLGCTVFVLYRDQDYVGGHYHALEIFSFAADRADLLASAQQEVEQVALNWNRISPWLPWMKMGGRPGILIFHAVGTRLSDWQQLPEPLRGQIADEFALYQSPPPLDDTRPNETTWTNFMEDLEREPSE